MTAALDTRARPLVVRLTDAAASNPGRFGPKAASLSRLARAGLPTPGGAVLDAEAYRIQLAHLGLEAAAAQVAWAESPLARRRAVEVRLGLMEGPLAPAVGDALLTTHAELTSSSPRLVVRSSALVEDRAGSSFAGQFDSYLGVRDEADFLTSVRACWAALWSTRVLRYMATHAVDPSTTAMAVLIQPLVEASASGGGLSRADVDAMVLTAAPGLGSAVAQGEVVPDRYVLGREAVLRGVEPGRTEHGTSCRHAPPSPVPGVGAHEAGLDRARAERLGSLLLAAEEVMGYPVEIEWALDNRGFTLLQARPLEVGLPVLPDPIWTRHPGLRGQPSGVGWGTGRACVLSCECELGRVAPGDVLVTRIAGPALSRVLPSVAGVVAELGGSTSHLASLGRERGIPMVLGVPDATRQIPEGAQVAVDAVAGLVRWAARAGSEATRP